MMLDSIKIDFVGRSMGVSGLRRARVCVMFHFNLDVRKMFYSHLVKPKRITEYHNVCFFSWRLGNWLAAERILASIYRRTFLG